MLIDQTYFVGNLNIPGSESDPVLETLLWFIAKHEPVFLQKVLGYSLYKVYKADASDARIVAILSGAEYTDYNGNLRMLAPLVNTTTKESPIANYVYYWYMRNKATITTGVSEAKGVSENTVSVSPRQKMISAWNEMHNWMLDFLDFMYVKNLASPQVYPEFTDINHYEAAKSLGFMNPIF
jgi:hypothetical protein